MNEEPKNISSLIQSRIPEYKLERFHGKEVSYTLPSNSVQKFHHLFEDIERNSRMLDVASFGVSMTTLEEVFLKLGKLYYSKF